MGTLYGKGINQPDLIAALNEIITDWNATMAKLDADTGITATDYASTCSMSSNTAVTNANGISQEDVIEVLQDAITKIAACTAKLDSDGLTASDFASEYDITDIINSAGTQADEIDNTGMSQGALILMLSAIKDSVNGILAHLDEDEVVNDTDYAATNPISFAIDTTGC